MHGVHTFLQSGCDAEPLVESALDKLMTETTGKLRIMAETSSKGVINARL